LARALLQYGTEWIDGQTGQPVGLNLQVAELMCALGVPAIKWKRQMLVVVSDGTKMTGGYGVKVTSLGRSHRVLTVHWQVESPGSGEPVIECLTHPAQVVLVKRFNGPVKFAPPERVPDPTAAFLPSVLPSVLPAAPSSDHAPSDLIFSGPYWSATPSSYLRAPLPGFTD
jgi:hypothetical protein